MAEHSAITMLTVRELQERGVLLVEDGNHGEYRPRPNEFADQGVAYIRAADMDDGRVLFDTASKINAVARERIRKGIGSLGDVLLSHKGTVGKVALVPPQAPAFVCSPQTTFWRSLDEEQLDRGFLFAYMKSDVFQAQLASLKGETDMADYVSLTTQRGLKVPLPAIHLQRNIATVLGALDEKIELNRRTSETLEEMARALFKSWFTAFDPVRARAEDRTPPLMGAATAALFPNSFEDSKLGMVPRGWRVARLGEVLELKRGYDLPKSQRRPGAVPVVSSSGPSGFHSESKVSGPGVVTGRYGTIGRVFFVRSDYWPLNTTLYLQNTKGNELLFLYHLLETLDFGKFSDKAAVPGINRNHVHEEVVVVPPCPLQQAFRDQVQTWMNLAAVCEEESVTLRNCRDALLPRLLSGELRVRDAERLLEQVA